MMKEGLIWKILKIRSEIFLNEIIARKIRWKKRYLKGTLKNSDGDWIILLVLPVSLSYSINKMLFFVILERENYYSYSFVHMIL